MRSPAGWLLLTRCRPVGTPAAGIPRKTVSTKRGSAGVPSVALKIWTQCGAHSAVAALATGGPSRLRPLATVSVAAATTIFCLRDTACSLLELQPCPAHDLPAPTCAIAVSPRPAGNLV